MTGNWISIHAPARGATYPKCFGEYQADFNPRSRKGSDMRHKISSHAIIISIHAPARGATTRKRKKRITKAYFNPRSRKGSDWFSSFTV